MTTVDFSGGTGPAGSEGSGLNDLGQVAYRVVAQGSDRAVAIWSGPRVTPIIPPELVLELTAPNSIRLKWNQDGNHWLLEAATDLHVGDWNLVDVEPANQGGEFWSVDLPIEGKMQFFRLVNDSVN